MHELFRLEEADRIAALILRQAEEQGASLILLSGELGAGKTTLVQAIGALLGVKEKIISPTFVVMKRYPIESVRFDFLVHMDAYRIEREEELEPLRFDKVIHEPRTLIIIEWPERIEKALKEKPSLSFSIQHHDADTRSITQPKA